MANSELYDMLENLLNTCHEHFKNVKSHNGKAFVNILTSLNHNMTYIRPIACEVIAKEAWRYDVSEEIKANGYRSLLSILESLLMNVITVLQNIIKEKNHRFFSSNFYVDKLGTNAEVLHQLRGIVYYAKVLIGLTENGEIFIDEKNSEDMLHDAALMCKSCFYGHTQGFQFYPGIQPIVQSLSLFAASYSDVRDQSSFWKTAKSAFQSSKYLVSPGSRGDKIDKMYSQFDIKFFKDFWSLPELLPSQVHSLISTNVQVNRSFVLPSDVLNLPTKDGKTIEVFRGSCLNKKNEVTCRLISHKLFHGQNDPNSPAMKNNSSSSKKANQGAPKSKYLIFFCHGGGFVALTSKSYEPMLREWSKEIGCPILSVDYSLAPEAPFPEAFEECFYAYAWALMHAHYLGTTAEKVIFVGDSAGGNLVLTTSLRAATYNIQMPHAVIPVYPACAIKFCASPSRLLSVLDPLLPTCLLTGCLTSYAGFKTKAIQFNAEQVEPHAQTSCPMQQNKTSSEKTSVFSTFFRDVGQGFRGMTTSASESEMSHQQNWWDETVAVYGDNSSLDSFEDSNNTKFTVSDNGFELVDVDTNENEVKDGNNLQISASDGNLFKHSHREDEEEAAEFKLKFPGKYQPYKSKHYNKKTIVFSTPISQNPYLSPALAPDEMLKTLPYMDIIACELDPLFDDSIHLVKRLTKLGVPHKFHIVRGLPHGFLNLQICKEAKDASKMCMNLIKQHTVEEPISTEL